MPPPRDWIVPSIATSTPDGDRRRVLKMTTARTTGPHAGGRVRRTADRLADGREILYYDDTEPYVSGGA